MVANRKTLIGELVWMYGIRQTLIGGGVLKLAFLAKWLLLPEYHGSGLVVFVEGKRGPGRLLQIVMFNTRFSWLIAGRVIQQTDRWDLSQCTTQARLAFLLSRAWWSLRQAVEDAKGKSESIMQKFSIDEPDQQVCHSSCK